SMFNLPLKYRTFLIATTLFFLVFSIYVKTSCKTIYLGDSPEFAAASYILGVAHPTGYPLFLMLGKLCTIIIPFGSIAFRANMLSVLCMAISAFLIFKIGKPLSLNPAIAAFIALCTLFTPTIWAEAGVSKVYMLNLTFLLLSLYLFFKFEKTKDIRLLFTIFLTVGLGLSNHIFLIIFLIPFFIFLMSKRYRSLFDIKKISISLALLLLGLSIYIYIPLRTSMNPNICWGKPDNIPRLKTYITQQQYNVKKGVRDFSDFLFLLKKWILLIPSEYGWAITLTIAIGIFAFFIKRRRIFIFLMSIILINLMIVWFYGVGKEFHLVYHIPVVVLSGLFAYGLLSIDRVKKLLTDVKSIYCIFPLIVFFIFSKNYFIANRNDHQFGYFHGINIMNTMDKGAVFFGETDTALFPLYYLSFVENYRRDVKIIDRQMNVAYFLDGNFAHINPEEEMKIIKKSSGEVYYGEYPRLNEINSTEYGLIHRVLKGNPESSFTSYDFTKLYNNFFETYENIFEDQWTRELIAIYYLLDGNFLKKENNNQEALESFEKARILGSEQTGILHNLSIYYEDMGENEKALSTLDEIISHVKKEESYQYIYLKAALYYRLGDNDNAEKYFKETKKGAIKNTWTYYYLGNIYYLRGKIDDAINYYRISVDVEPSNYKSLINLGVLYKNVGLYKNAIESFQNALKYSPASMECYFNLAAIYSILQDKE
ncbi:DUF2723 domain-containing protein, partial [bacterium]|nr:DUF2723 domain-containing protein [bacterium]